MSRSKNIRYVKRNGYLYVYCYCDSAKKWVPIKCVSCDKVLEHDINSRCIVHKCSEKHIRSREAASNRETECGSYSRTPTFGERLIGGFKMMNWSEHLDSYDSGYFRNERVEPW